MYIDEHGDYHLDDGRVIPAAQIGKLHKTAPRTESVQPSPEKKELSEGEASGVIRLED